MRCIPLWFPCSLAVVVAIFGTALLPQIRLFAFAPLLAVLYNQKTLIYSLWIASLCGVLIDLLSSDMHFGLYALNYCLTTLLIYKQKHHFFDDKPLALSLFTALISFTSTLIQFFLIAISDQGIPITWKLALTDLIGMPLIDAIYAYLWFTCPMQLYIYIQKGNLLRLWHRLRLYWNHGEQQ